MGAECCKTLDSDFGPSQVTTDPNFSTRTTTLSFWYPVPEDSLGRLKRDLQNELSKGGQDWRFNVRVTIVRSRSGQVSLKPIIGFLLLNEDAAWHGRIASLEFKPHSDLTVAPKINDLGGTAGMLEEYKRRVEEVEGSFTYSIGPPKKPVDARRRK